MHIIAIKIGHLFMAFNFVSRQKSVYNNAVILFACCVNFWNRVNVILIEPFQVLCLAFVTSNDVHQHKADSCLFYFVSFSWLVYQPILVKNQIFYIMRFLQKSTHLWCIILFVWFDIDLINGAWSTVQLKFYYLCNWALLSYWTGQV